jgi:16S rRNA (adenine1518-N6/adenine1519-N6)-dimethyltransferase
MRSARELKQLLAAEGLRLSKRLGQHHLIDASMIGKIIRACGLRRDDTVVELGAGLGALTTGLAEAAHAVLALEIDAGIAAVLRRDMRAHPHVEVRHQDMLDFDWRAVTDVVVVGAIPYHITSPILIALSEQRAAIRHAILIVQDEVAQRIAAKPGTKAYGRLTVLMQSCWRVEPLFRVPRSAFFPQPSVDSSCLRLKPGPAGHGVTDQPALFELAKRAFGQRRKTLVNCLDGWVARPEVESALAELGLPASVRGETLTLEQFSRLAERLRPNT